MTAALFILLMLLGRDNLVDLKQPYAGAVWRLLFPGALVLFSVCSRRLLGARASATVASSRLGRLGQAATTLLVAAVWAGIAAGGAAEAIGLVVDRVADEELLLYGRVVEREVRGRGFCRDRLVFRDHGGKRHTLCLRPKWGFSALPTYGALAVGDPIVLTCRQNRVGIVADRVTDFAINLPR